MHYQPDVETDVYVQELIAYKVRRIIGRYGFTKSDRDDLMQELHFTLFLAGRKYNPFRSNWRTYAEHVLANKIRAIAQTSRAAKRDWRRITPYQNLDQRPARTPTPEQVDLTIDLRHALRDLRPTDQSIARGLAETDQAKVARSHGMSRQQVRAARQRIKHHLQHRYLRQENPKSPTTSGRRPVNNRWDHA